MRSSRGIHPVADKTWNITPAVPLATLLGQALTRSPAEAAPHGNGSKETAGRSSAGAAADSGAQSEAKVRMCAIAMSSAMRIGSTSRAVCANRYPP